MRLALSALALAGLLVASASAQAAPVSAAKGFAKNTSITEVARKKKPAKKMRMAKKKKKMM